MTLTLGAVGASISPGRREQRRAGEVFYNRTLTPAITVGPGVWYPFAGSNFE
jgi:hypothetical protein